MPEVPVAIIGVVILSIASGTQYKCNFDAPNLCGQWVQMHDDDMDWTRISGPAPNSESFLPTGPRQGFGGSGFYLYMEATNHHIGEKARLQSLSIGPGNVVLSFMYMVFGKNVGQLRIYRTVWGTYKEQLFRPITSQYRREWQKLVVRFQAMEPCRVIFEATRGDGWSADIAIDDVEITVTDFTTPGCSRSNSSPSATPKRKFTRKLCFIIQFAVTWVK